MKREQSLQHGESVDRYMPTEESVRNLNGIEMERKSQINALSRNDPDYAKKVEMINKRAKQTRYRAMKALNTTNEKIPQ